MTTAFRLALLDLPDDELVKMVEHQNGSDLFSIVADHDDVPAALKKLQEIRDKPYNRVLPIAAQQEFDKLCSMTENLINTPDED